MSVDMWRVDVTEIQKCEGFCCRPAKASSARLDTEMGWLQLPLGSNYTGAVVVVVVVVVYRMHAQG